MSATRRLELPTNHIAQTAVQNISIIVSSQMMQSGSTRPERISTSLAGLQELNSKTLQELQQQLQAHLTAAHQELRAQVMLPLAGRWAQDFGGGIGGQEVSVPVRCLKQLT